MLGYADYVFTSVFTVEIVLKVTLAMAEIDKIALMSSSLGGMVFNFDSSLPHSCLDDSLRSFSAHWLLL